MRAGFLSRTLSPVNILQAEVVYFVRSKSPMQLGASSKYLEAVNVAGHVSACEPINKQHADVSQRIRCFDPIFLTPNT